jgi:Co/Zn/Cd efflux system component
MGSCCHDPVESSGLEPGSPAFVQYRKVLWVAFLVNLAMFFIEIFAALRSDSLSLMADSIDFFGDAANYLVSLAVLGASLSWRAGTAMLKGAFMLGFGVFVGIQAIGHYQAGVVPEAATMGAVGFLALLANLGVAYLLFHFRNGDANMRSVWLCTRNDALGNLAVLAAAAGVMGTATGWPDLLVAAIMAALALTSGTSVIRQARRELQHDAADAHGVQH